VAYTYDFKPAYDLVLIRSDGIRWTGRDLLESGEEIVADDQFCAHYDWLYDARLVHQTVITTEEMERVLERFRAFREEDRVDPGSRSVIVGMDEDLRASGILYQHKAGRSDDQLAIVDTLEEALQWLGVECPASALEPAE
jgi:hypothetical protein